MLYPVFPQELFDHIIEFAQDDYCTPSLATTSLVSSNWLRTSRKYLFHTLVLQPPTLEGFLNLVSNRPTFLPCVHHLILDPSDKETESYICLDNQLLSWFPKLDHVKLLSIYGLEWESTDVLNRFFSSVLPSTTTLDLRVDFLQSTDCVKELFYAFSSLTRVVVTGTLRYHILYRLDGKHGVALTRLPEPDIPFLPNLKSLSFPRSFYPREFFIRNILLGSQQLNEFRVYIETAEGAHLIQNLVVFMKHHCLNTSSLQITLDESLCVGRETLKHFQIGGKLHFYLM